MRREMYDKLNQNKSPLTLVQPDPRQGTQLAEVKLSHCQVIMYVESLWYLSFIYYDLATWNTLSILSFIYQVLIFVPDRMH